MTRAVVLRIPLSADHLAALDAWIAGRTDPKPSRREAVRRLSTCAMVDHLGQ